MCLPYHPFTSEYQIAISQCVHGMSHISNSYCVDLLGTHYEQFQVSNIKTTIIPDYLQGYIISLSVHFICPDTK